MCPCLRHDDMPGAFVFIAHKSPSGLSIVFNDPYIYQELSRLTDSEDFMAENIGQGFAVNGLVLLKNFQRLKSRLVDLSLAPHAATDPLISAMDLLIHGFLADGEVFKSFGYEELYELGYLSFELWKEYQHAQLEKDISLLEEGFFAIDADQFDNNLSAAPMQQNCSGSVTWAAGNLDSSCDEVHKSHHESYESMDVSAPNQYFKDLEEDGLEECLDHPKYQIETAKAGHEEAVWLPPVKTLGGWSYSWALVKAAMAGDEKVVRLLLDGRAKLDSFCISIALTEAAKAGHEEVVRLLFDRGAILYDWFYRDALTEAAKAGRKEVVRLLLDGDAKLDGFDISKALIEAAKAGHQGVVRLLLDGGTILNDPSGSTALIKAAEAGDEEAVRQLLNGGAKVNSYVGSIVLAEAVEAGRGEVVRLLLTCGVKTSLLPARKTVIRLLIDERRRKQRQEAFVQLLQNQPPLRSLYEAFVKQHTAMIHAAEDASTDFQEFTEAFQNRRYAWQTGIMTLRMLCNGKLVSGIGEILTFLCVARAISETLDFFSGSDYRQQFLYDLKRWEIAFDDRTLNAYREAVLKIWNIELDKIFRPGDGSTANIVQHFGDLASSLVRQTTGLFEICHPRSNSLEHSQRQWRQRQSQVSYPINSDPGFCWSMNPAGQLPEDTPSEPKDPDQPVHNRGRSPSKMIHANAPPVYINPKVIVLMAGAIFMCVLVFFLGKLPQVKLEIVQVL